MTDRRALDLDHELSRRKFLTGLGLAGTVVAGSYVIDTWARPITAGAASNPPKQSAKNRHTVVFVELAGGNDGIGTVIPYTDPNYRQLRPTLAIDNPLDLDGSVGLHPSLAKLADRYRAGQVAIVEGIGYPRNDLSHFASLANWWSGTPGQANDTGWLGRYLDQTVGFSIRSPEWSSGPDRRPRWSERGRSQPASPTPPVSNPPRRRGSRIPTPFRRRGPNSRRDAPTARRCSARYRRRSASPATRAPTSHASSRRLPRPVMTTPPPPLRTPTAPRSRVSTSRPSSSRRRSHPRSSM